MTRMIGRLVLAMLLLPTTGAVFLVLMAPVLAAATNGPPDALLLLAAWTGVYLYIGAYWTLLWRRLVRWTRWRTLATAASVPAAIAAGIGFGLIFSAVVPGAPIPIAIMIGGGAPPIVWTLATVLIWCETPRERGQRLASITTGGVVCPVCGYNMTGLRDAVCPECGAAFTLEQLLAGQPMQDDDALIDRAAPTAARCSS